jgi:formamidopyrimidine-DNA glycosylase
MPELPEVETIRMQLEKYLVGHVVESVEERHKGILRGDYKRVEGGKVTGVRRFGKVTVIDLSNGYSVLIHVKLTGQIVYRGLNLGQNSLSKKVTGGLGGAHTHVIFHLDSDGKLFYNDVRRFGWIEIIQSSNVKLKSL